MEREEDLVARIEEARRKRDMLRMDLSNLQTRIRYHSSRGRTSTVKALQKEMKRVKKEYEKAKERVNELVRRWQKVRKDKKI